MYFTLAILMLLNFFSFFFFLKGYFNINSWFLSLQVEMFGITASETGIESDDLLQYILSIETELSEELGLHFR